MIILFFIFFVILKCKHTICGCITKQMYKKEKYYKHKWTIKTIFIKKIMKKEKKFGTIKKSIYLCTAKMNGEIAQLVRASDS